MSEATLAIARLAQKFTITIRADGPVLPVGTLTTRPDHAPPFVLQPREATLDPSSGPVLGSHAGV